MASMIDVVEDYSSHWLTFIVERVSGKSGLHFVSLPMSACIIVGRVSGKSGLQFVSLSMSACIVYGLCVGNCTSFTRRPLVTNR